ncbi:hypothetical protein [Streptomyces phaeochromogenes]|uniref:hypothetical protein n=1 Tax=Streptomyces phaeochromogenes TaxID=1923 RepID=UPI002E0F0A3A|nr:hypothetical protein OG437_43310 [Streptomyces phaeochromogenes]
MRLIGAASREQVDSRAGYTVPRLVAVLPDAAQLSTRPASPGKPVSGQFGIATYGQL